MSVDPLSEEQVIAKSVSLAAIHAAAFSESGMRSWSKNEFEELARRKTFAVFLADHGFLALDLVEQEAEILTIAVVPTEQNKGIGSELLKRSANWLQSMKVSKCYLEVAENNKNAIALYEAAQFKQISRRPGYIQGLHGAIDALIMVKMFDVQRFHKRST